MRCPTCHQPIRHERFGIFLSPRRAQIVDLIRTAGEGGVTQAYIANSLKLTLDAVRSHVYQINDLLVETDWRIASDRSGYRLVRK